MLRKNLPNILTLSNLTFGMLAILIASSTDKINIWQQGIDISKIYFSCLFVALAALIDRFDGKLARYWGVTSNLGKQLDSLCDLISFGVAPTVIAWKLNFAYAQIWIPFGRTLGYLVALAFTITGAVRLARFNLLDDPDEFQGIPITLAGSILTLLNFFNTFMFIRGKFGSGNVLSTMILMVILSVLMVSKFKMKKI